MMTKSAPVSNAPHADSCSCSRRSFLAGSLSCGSFVLFGLAAGTAAARKGFGQHRAGDVVATEKFARLEKVADGVWAMVSTPWGKDGQVHGATFSNGGIIVGKDAVLCVEGFNTPTGAAWLSDAALEVAGGRPTYVVITHYHGDHTHGIAGYQRGDEGPQIIATETTRAAMYNSYADLSGAEAEDGLKPVGNRQLLPDTVVADPSGKTEIDLGGRTVTLWAMDGHTQSDLLIEIDEPQRIVWSGDLVFNGLFPYYGDATPSVLRPNVQKLVDAKYDLYVPGHGSVMQAGDFDHYLNLLDDVEAAAKKAHTAGKSTDEAWQEYNVPDSLGEWKKFRPDVYKFGFEAWYKELM